MSSRTMQRGLVMSLGMRHDYPMQIKRRPTALGIAGAYFLWEVVVQPIWNLNLERLAEQEKIDTTLARGGSLMDTLRAAVEYIPSSFGLGFVIGALIFAYWDAIVPMFQRHVLRKERDLDLRAWVGTIVPYLEDDSTITLRISIIGVGQVPFRIDRVEGHIWLKHDRGDGTRVRVRLPAPIIKDNPTADAPLCAGYFGELYLLQQLPREVAEIVPEVFGWRPYPSMEFEDLNIVLVSQDGRHSKPLKLWESARLSAGAGQVRADQTMKLFKNDDEARAFNENFSRLAQILAKRN